MDREKGEEVLLVLKLAVPTVVSYVTSFYDGETKARGFSVDVRTCSMKTSNTKSDLKPNLRSADLQLLACSDNKLMVS